MLLILLAWQGPIPVCHAHGSLRAERLPSVELASHLIENHSATQLSSEVFIDWHWHWVMPDDLLPKHSDSSTPSPDEEHASIGELRPVIQVQSVEVDFSCNVAISEILIDHLDVWHRLSLRRQDLPTSFLMTFASDLSLPERLSVYRC
jgi:hypothetical protein